MSVWINTRGTCRIAARKLELVTCASWPGIDRDTDLYVRYCHGGQLVGQSLSS